MYQPQSSSERFQICIDGIKYLLDDTLQADRLGDALAESKDCGLNIIMGFEKKSFRSSFYHSLERVKRHDQDQRRDNSGILTLMRRIREK